MYTLYLVETSIGFTAMMAMMASLVFLEVKLRDRMDKQTFECVVEKWMVCFNGRTYKSV